MNQKVRGAIRSRFMWVGTLYALAGAVEYKLGVLKPFLAPEDYALITFFTGVLIQVLRWDTTHSLEDKGK